MTDDEKGRSRLLIKRDDLRGAEIQKLLRDHLQSMTLYSPADSIHALDLDALRRPEVTFWSVWEADLLLGCGALQALEPLHGEVKSMRTAGAQRGEANGDRVARGAASNSSAALRRVVPAG